jgi:peptide chain release factor
MKMKTKFIQITTGKGPAECCLAVALALKEIIAEAKACGLKHEVISRHAGEMNGTLSSAMVELKGGRVDDFVAGWTGVLLWIAQSPYRRMHKRRNWFIGINELSPASIAELDERDLVFQTMRSSGPGGQHVNKTESAVRVLHPPTGLFAVSDTYRSQLQNKQEAIRRLKEKYAQWQQKKLEESAAACFQNNQNLKRGDPRRIYKGEKFLRHKNQ